MARAELAPGSTLGDTYRIVRRLAGGGMGEVYEVTHARLAGRYALKILNQGADANPEAFYRFRREAMVISGLRHPGIVQVIDFNSTPDGLPYMVMEYLDGQQLADIIAQAAPIPLTRTTRIVEQIASALGAAHRQGIVHRDLKPQNIIIMPAVADADAVKIVDFGISKVQNVSPCLTSETALLGTPQYMAPEQALGRSGEVDGRADQFALAVITYEMLSGRAPFRGDNLVALVYQIVNVDPTPVAAFVADLPAEVDIVLRRALAKDPSGRFSSVEDMAGALRDAGCASALAPTINVSTDSSGSPNAARTAKEGSVPPCFVAPTDTGRGALSGSRLAAVVAALGLAVAAVVWAIVQRSPHDVAPPVSAPVPAAAAAITTPLQPRRVDVTPPSSPTMAPTSTTSRPRRRAVLDTAERLPKLPEADAGRNRHEALVDDL